MEPIGKPHLQLLRTEVSSADVEAGVHTAMKSSSQVTQILKVLFCKSSRKDLHTFLLAQILFTSHW